MVGSAELTTEMSNTTNTWATKSRARIDQDFRCGSGAFARS